MKSTIFLAIKYNTYLGFKNRQSANFLAHVDIDRLKKTI